MCVRDSDMPLKPDQCRPLVHHSVRARCDLCAEYRPSALRGLEFNVFLPDGNVVQLSGIAGLREASTTPKGRTPPWMAPPRPRSTKGNASGDTG